MLKAPKAHCTAPQTHQLPHEPLQDSYYQSISLPAYYLQASNPRLANIALLLRLRQLPARCVKVSLLLPRHILCPEKDCSIVKQPVGIKCIVNVFCTVALLVSLGTPPLTFYFYFTSYPFTSQGILYRVSCIKEKRLINMLSLQEYGKSSGKYGNIQLFEFNVNVSNIKNASLIQLFVFYITAFNKSLY